MAWRVHVRGGHTGRWAATASGARSTMVGGCLLAQDGEAGPLKVWTTDEMMDRLKELNILLGKHSPSASGVEQSSDTAGGSRSGEGSGGGGFQALKIGISNRTMSEEELMDTYPGIVDAVKVSVRAGAGRAGWGRVCAGRRCTGLCGSEGHARRRRWSTGWGRGVSWVTSLTVCLPRHLAGDPGGAPAARRGPAQLPCQVHHRAGCQIGGGAAGGDGAAHLPQRVAPQRPVRPGQPRGLVPQHRLPVHHVHVERLPGARARGARAHLRAAPTSHRPGARRGLHPGQPAGPGRPWRWHSRQAHPSLDEPNHPVPPPMPSHAHHARSPDCCLLCQLDVPQDRDVLAPNGNQRVPRSERLAMHQWRATHLNAEAAATRRAGQ